MAVSYAHNNETVLHVGIEEFLRRVVRPRIIAMCNAVAQRMVQYIDNGFVMPDGTTQFPVDTANMHDATGVGVFDNGVMKSYIPTKRATKKARTGLGSPKTGIDGTTLLQTALSDAASTYSRGIWIVLFSTVPYAYYIETMGSKIGRGAGYFRNLENALFNEVMTGLAPIAPIG